MLTGLLSLGAWVQQRAASSDWAVLGTDTVGGWVPQIFSVGGQPTVAQQPQGQLNFFDGFRRRIFAPVTCVVDSLRRFLVSLCVSFRASTGFRRLVLRRDGKADPDDWLEHCVGRVIEFRLVFSR